MMDQKVTLQQLVSFGFTLLLGGVIMFLVVDFSNLPANQSTSEPSEIQTGMAQGEAFEHEPAITFSAMHWQAMGRFYEAQARLPHDDFDYERAAEVMAYRWNAMAKAYQRLGLLNHSSDSDDVLATPWYLLFSVNHKRNSKW